MDSRESRLGEVGTSGNTSAIEQSFLVISRSIRAQQSDLRLT